jgi:hypothetical protein
MLRPGASPAMQAIAQRQQQQRQQRQQSRDSDPECYDLLRNLPELLESDMNPYIDYFNKLSSFKNNLDEALSSGESEPLTEEINVKTQKIIDCLAKKINQDLTKAITPSGGGKTRNRRNKNKRTKRKRY